MRFKYLTRVKQSNKNARVTTFFLLQDNFENLDYEELSVWVATVGKRSDLSKLIREKKISGKEALLFVDTLCPLVSKLKSGGSEAQRSPPSSTRRKVTAPTGEDCTKHDKKDFQPKKGQQTKVSQSLQHRQDEEDKENDDDDDSDYEEEDDDDDSNQEELYEPAARQPQSHNNSNDHIKTQQRLETAVAVSVNPNQGYTPNIPPMWKIVKDPKTGKTYYYNIFTHATQYDPPQTD